MTKSKVYKDKHKLIVAFLVGVGGLFYCEILVIRAYLYEDIALSELVIFRGRITDYKETDKGGTGKHPIILYTLNGLQSFEISNTAYEIAYLSEIREAIENKEVVEVGTLQEYLDRANNKSIKDRILNKIIAYRRIPRTIYLKREKSIPIRLEDYNEAQRERRNDNLLWGTGIIIVFIGLFTQFIRDLWKSKSVED